MDPFVVTALAAEPSQAAETVHAVVSAITTGGGVDTSTLFIPTVIEYAALITGAVSGALLASERNLDIVGAVGLAIVTGLGGGVLRDVILPTTSIYMLDHPVAILTCVFIGVLAFYFSSLFTRLDPPLMLADILSVAFFAFSGTDKALMADYNAIACIMLGTITAIGGGVLRDICLNEVPTIFKRGTYYAIAALGGATAYTILAELGVIKVVGLLACVVVTLTLRFVSVHYNLQSSTAVDLTPRVIRPLRKAWSSILVARRHRASASRRHRITRPIAGEPMRKPGLPLRPQTDDRARAKDVARGADAEAAAPTDAPADACSGAPSSACPPSPSRSSDDPDR